MKLTSPKRTSHLRTIDFEGRAVDFSGRVSTVIWLKLLYFFLLYMPGFYSWGVISRPRNWSHCKSWKEGNLPNCPKQFSLANSDIVNPVIHHWKLTWNQTWRFGRWISFSILVIFRFHLNFWGSTLFLMFFFLKFSSIDLKHQSLHFHPSLPHVLETYQVLPSILLPLKI